MKYYSDEGFVEHKIELGDEDLEEIIREYLERDADFDFDEASETSRCHCQAARWRCCCRCPR